jgi:hypothetical protein
MRLFLVFALIFTIAFGAVEIFAAQDAERHEVKINKRKKFPRSKLTVKFLSVVEDSRCPEGANCIWAGNAKIKVEISDGKATEVFEMNTNLGPKGATFDGYDVNLVELSPAPTSESKTNPNSYTAVFEIVRLTR